MQTPLHIRYGNLTDTQKRELEDIIRAEIDHLETVTDEVTSCDVAIERPNENLASGSPWRVRVKISHPPHQELVAKHEAGHGDAAEPLGAIIRGVFEALRRQLDRALAKMRDDVKHHEEPVALVTKLFDEADYGFLRTPDGREVYFHKNAVVHDGFDRLTVGTEVRFVETDGNEGPQASTVQIIDKPGDRPKDGQEESGVVPEGWRSAG